MALRGPPLAGQDPRGPPGDRVDPSRIRSLERILKSLGNANRIQLLVMLQKPRRVTEIDLTPSRDSVWGGASRPISRQAVKQHIEALQDIGVLAERQDGPHEVRYVVDHARLFEVTEQLRELATVRPEEPMEKDTLNMELTGQPQRHAGPHLVLVRGVREGQVFPLSPPAPEEGWLVGRAQGAHVRLDFDPYVSAGHARVLARKGQHFVMDLQRSRNGTFLNWQRMTKGGVAPLESGDLIGVGMSLLLYRAGRGDAVPAPEPAGDRG